MSVEKRRFHRINFTARCELRHNKQVYPGQLQNISLNGALANFQESTLSFIKTGERCFFAIYPGTDESPLQFMVEIMHTSFSFGGMKFIAMDAETRTRLIELIEILTSEPDKLRTELAQMEREYE